MNISWDFLKVEPADLAAELQKPGQTNGSGFLDRAT